MVWRYFLMVVAILWTGLGLVWSLDYDYDSDNDYVLMNYQLNKRTTSFKFLKTQFEEFYMCLSGETTSKCTAKYNNYDNIVIDVETTESSQRKERNTLQFYRCQKSSRQHNIVCKRTSLLSCNGSETCQAIMYSGMSSTSSECVTFILQINENISFNGLKISIRTTKCECLSTSSIQTTSSSTTTKSTKSTKSRSTTITKSIKSTKTTTMISSTMKSTITSMNVQPSSTTEAYITSSTNESIPYSDNQTDNNATPIILGVILPLVAVITIAFIVVFVWRRKCRSSGKPPTDVHDYVHFAPSTTPVTAHNGTQKHILAYSNQDLPNKYSNVDNAAYDNDADVDGNMNITAAEGGSKDRTEFVYSQAGSLGTQSMYGNVRVTPAECNPSNDETIGYFVPSGYTSIENTLDESNDANESIYTVANNSGLNNTSLSYIISGTKPLDNTSTYVCQKNTKTTRDSSSVEYSLAGDQQFTNMINDTRKSDNVYAKLHEELRNTNNPYNVLADDTPAQIPSETTTKSSIEKTSENQESLYSMGQSIGDTSANANTNGIVLNTLQPCPGNPDTDCALNKSPSDQNIYVEMEADEGDECHYIYH